MKMKISPILVTLALFCSMAAGPNAQAVNPPPDGGYSNFNTAEGQKVPFSLTTGAANTAVGWFSLFSNAEGSFNTATGAGTLLFNTADENTATGAAALLSNTTGDQNTANGTLALYSNTTGSSNTASGIFALFSNTTGTQNTANGRSPLYSNTTGANNTALGWGAGTNVTTANNVISIGAGVLGQNVSNSCFIGNIHGQSPDPATVMFVGVDASGRLGTQISSRRFKHDIKRMDKTSDVILALKPVSFRYNSDARSTPCFGLIAEEVAEVSPDLIVRDKNGELLSVRYDQVNAMLLNEFLKEHHKVEEQGGKLENQAGKMQEQETTIAQLKKDFQATVAQLTARLEEQASQIQKVTAQLAAASPSRGGLEASKPAPQMALNNP